MILALFLSIPSFAAAKVEIWLDGHKYEHLVLLTANYDRLKSRVVVRLGLWKDAAYYAANKRDPRHVYTKILPFSYFPTENLSNVKSLTESALVVSEIEDGIETNPFVNAEIVAD